MLTFWNRNANLFFLKKNVTTRDPIRAPPKNPIYSLWAKKKCIQYIVYLVFVHRRGRHLFWRGVALLTIRTSLPSLAHNLSLRMCIYLGQAVTSRCWLFSAPCSQRYTSLRHRRTPALNPHLLHGGCRGGRGSSCCSALIVLQPPQSSPTVQPAHEGLYSTTPPGGVETYAGRRSPGRQWREVEEAHNILDASPQRGLSLSERVAVALG